MDSAEKVVHADWPATLPDQKHCAAMMQARHCPPCPPLPPSFFGYTHLTGGWDGGQAEFVRVPYADLNCLKVGQTGACWAVLSQAWAKLDGLRPFAQQVQHSVAQHSTAQRGGAARCTWTMGAEHVGRCGCAATTLRRCPALWRTTRW